MGYWEGPQPIASPTSLQVKVIKDKAIDTAHYSPLGNADQSMGEDLPSDEAIQSREDTDQAIVEELPPNEAMKAKGDTNQYILEHLSPVKAEHYHSHHKMLTGPGYKFPRHTATHRSVVSGSS